MSGKETPVTQFAFVSIALGVGAQIFWDFSPLLLPGMAMADGGAIYPSISKMATEFSYRCAPYLFFGISLAAALRWQSPWTNAVSIGSIVGVFCPFIAMAWSMVVGYPVSEFREHFWPVRPLVQAGCFLVTAWICLAVVTIRDRWRPKKS